MALTPARGPLRRLVLAAMLILSMLNVHAEGVTIPKIPRPQAVPVSKTLARSLAAWDKEQARWAKECAKDMAESRGLNKTAPGLIEFDLRYDVLLDSAHIYSVGQALSSFCGGAHPDFAENAAVFDISTGLRYDPLKLYAIGHPAAYGTELRPAVRQLIRGVLLAQRKPAPQGDECTEVLKRDEIRYLDKDTLALGAQGLHVMYAGPHVVQGCYGAVVLPYARLKSYLQAQEAQRLHWPH